MHDEDTLTQDSTAVAQALQLSARAEDKPASVPGYTLRQGLGEGSYGSVWLAREDNTGKQVAIKFYTHHRGLDWSLLNREVEKLAVLYTSRNIVRLVGVGWDSDPPYYVMEYLENGSLAAMLADGPIPPHEAVRIAKSVAQALVHAHGSGILHCDLKPANVLLDSDFEPRICDFGQSRLSNEQSPALGTLFYMAPEQADLNAIPDARWDVYALGALLFHMLCGHAPYWTDANESKIRSAETLDQRLAIYRQILKTSEHPTELRALSGVDRRLVEIVDRCLRIDPQRRFANAQAVLNAMEMRDRQRARRPLVALGIVGPGLLLLAMAFIVGNVLKKAVDNARATLVERALESDVQPARILAEGLSPKVQDKILELEHLARMPSLREAVINSPGRPWDERVALFAELLAAKKQIDNNLRERGRPLDRSWFVADARGWQWWRDPHSPLTDGRNYAFRDYFNGRRERVPEQNVTPIYSSENADPFPEVKPIRKPQVSEAFRSQANRGLIVAISVPVWNADQTEVIGVLARTTMLVDLLDDYGNGIRGGDEVDRVVALVQMADGKLLNHPGLSDELMSSLSDDDYDRLALPEPTATDVRQMLDDQMGGRGSADVRVARYIDPVGKAGIDPEERFRGEWLAAFVPIAGTGWAAVVQERREDALMPVVEMQSEMSRYALAGLIISCALVGLLWYFVFRALSDRGMRLWVRRSGSSRPSERGSTVSGR